MSIIRCDSCNRQVDTDKDTDCLLPEDEIMCKLCREEEGIAQMIAQAPSDAQIERLRTENNSLKEENRRLREKAIGSDASRFDERMGVRRGEQTTGEIK